VCHVRQAGRRGTPSVSIAYAAVLLSSSRPAVRLLEDDFLSVVPLQKPLNETLYSLLFIFVVFVVVDLVQIN
jgi:hypothetical protein